MMPAAAKPRQDHAPLPRGWRLRPALPLLALLLAALPAGPAAAQLSSQITVGGTAAKSQVSSAASRDVLLLAARNDGEPELSAQIGQAGNPQPAGEGRYAVSLVMHVANAGTAWADEISVRFDAAAIYGADGYRFSRARLLQQPNGFGAAINPYFDGGNRTDLLTSGGRLTPGQNLVLRTDLVVDTGKLDRVAVVEVGGLPGRGHEPLETIEAAAAPMRQPEESPGAPAAGCSSLSGTVFLDSNRDGLRQESETGIAGVRVSTDDTNAAVTDAAGRYDLACPPLEDDRKSGSFELVLDIATLPPGLGVSGGRRKTVTAGFEDGMAADFVVSAIPALTIVLEEADFAAGSVALNADGLGKINRVLAELAAERARLVVVLDMPPGDRLGEQRGTFVRSLAQAAWERSGAAWPLAVTVQRNETGG